MLVTKTLVTLRERERERERELHFSEIKYSLFSLSIFTLDSDKPINT